MLDHFVWRFNIAHSSLICLMPLTVSLSLPALQSFVHTSDLRMTSKQLIYKQQIQYKALHIDSLYVNGCAGVSHMGQIPQGEGLPPHAPQACGPGKEQAHT